MRSILISATLAAILSVAPWLGQAEESPMNPDRRQQGFQFNLTGGADLSAMHSPWILIEAEGYFERQNPNDNVWPKPWARYFWVRAAVELQTTGGGLEIPAFDVEVVPIETELLDPFVFQ